MEPPSKAPRIEAYLENTQGISAFATPRSQWDGLAVNSTEIVEIDVAATPMRELAVRASLIGAVANQSSTGGGRISVYRDDPKDAPTPVNVDHYTVWTNLAEHPQIKQFVTAASTSLDANLREFLQDNVLWVKEVPGDNHWLVSVPSSVRAVIRIQDADSD